MKISIVIPVLNSHEILRRQLLHFYRMGLPSQDVEVIIVDDGSDPPLTSDVPGIRIHQTHDYRPWTWSLARNAGARVARGDYLLMTDLDHIITWELLNRARLFTGDKMRCRREFGVLDENGHVTQEHDILMQWGLPAERIRDKGTHLPPHPSSFMMRRELFHAMGGYREDLIDKPYPQGEDRWFKKKWNEWVAAGRVQDDDPRMRPTILVFPNGQFCGDVDHNPFGMFHTLSRKSPSNHWHRKIESSK